MSDDKVLMIPGSLNLTCQHAEIKFQDKGEGKDSLPTFEMVAYTGGLMSVDNFPDPVAIQLSGMEIPSQIRPIRFQHNALTGVGHSTKIKVKDHKLFVEGVISRSTPEAMEVVASSKNGFPWQASVGVNPTGAVGSVEFIPETVSARVNGKTLPGPFFLLQASILREISFVDLGADPKTSAQVTAQLKGVEMEEGKKGTAPKLDLEGKKREAVEAADTAKAAAADALKIEAAAVEKTGAAAALKIEAVSTEQADAVTAAGIESGRRLRAAEVTREAEIRAVEGIDDTVLAKALSDGWTSQATELHVLRAARPKVSNASSVKVDSEGFGRVLECAAMVAGGGFDQSEVEKMYDDQTLQEAHNKFPDRAGLRDILIEAAWANGYTGTRFGTGKEVLRFAFARQGVQAAFSSVDTGGILSNIANKHLLEGFNAVEQTWRQITAIRNVRDFKTVTSYRLIGGEQYVKVGPGGKIEHGDLGEQTFTNKADTYALMLAITRQDIINDDLGALSQVPRKLGRGSGLKINDLFWNAFLDDANLFSSGNSNLLTGAGSALDIDALTLAEAAFMDLLDPQGQPLGTMPTKLLTGTALSASSAVLMRSAEIHDAATSNKIPRANPHQGKFTPIVSRYINNSNITGNSATAWWLLGDPRDIAVIEMAFLNGQESPTIETTEADFNTLGIQMRGFHDFGVNLQDPLGGVKNDGA